MSGLCSVLDSLRQSLESESESENDDLDPDGNSSTNSHALSWQGSLQQLPTTPSTSESEAGNMASEHHLCRQCGRARRRERARASGCSSLPPGRRLRPRLKKRAHFATDTDNSSDPERLSDSHESSLLFKLIAPSPNYMSTPLVSLSPREVKSVTFTSDTRPASTSALPTAQTKVTRPDTLMTCTSSPSGLASRAAPPSLKIAKGRKPFKADHELFKRHPSGLPCPAPVGQRPQARPSSSSTTSPTSPVPAAAVAGSGSPALPPRHPLKQTHTGYGKQHQPQHHNSSPNRNHHHHQYHHQHQHHIYQKHRNSLSSGDLSDPTRDSGYGSSATLTDSTHGRGGDGGGCASDNNVEHRGRQCSKRGPPIAPRSSSASRIGARDNFRHAMQQPPPPPPPPPPSSSFLQPSSPASSSPTAILLLPPPPPSLLVTPPDSPTAELPPPPPPLQLPGSETSPKLLSPTSPSQLLPPPHLPNLDLALSKQPSAPLPPPPPSQPVSGTPPIHPSVHNINKNCAKRTSLDDSQNLPGPRSNLQQMWNIARRSSRLKPDSETNNTTSNMSTKLYPDNTLAKRNSCNTEADHVTPPPRYEDAIKRVNVFRPAGSEPSSDHQSKTRADSMSVVSGTVTANGTKVKTSEAAPPVTRQNGTVGGAPVPCSGLEDTTPDTSYCSDRGGGQSPSPMQSGFVGQSIRQFEARAVSINSRNKFDYTTRNVSSSDRKDGTVGELMAGSGLPPRTTSSSKPMNGLAYQGGFRNHHGGKQSGSDVTPPVSGSLSNGHRLVPGFCREDSHVSDEVFLIGDDSRDDFADQSSGSSDNTDEKKRKPSNLIKSAIDERHLTYNRNDSGTKKLPDHDRNSKNIILEFLV